MLRSKGCCGGSGLSLAQHQGPRTAIIQFSAVQTKSNNLQLGPNSIEVCSAASLNPHGMFGNSASQDASAGLSTSTDRDGISMISLVHQDCSPSGTMQILSTGLDICVHRVGNVQSGNQKVQFRILCTFLIAGIANLLQMLYLDEYPSSKIRNIY